MLLALHCDFLDSSEYPMATKLMSDLLKQDLALMVTCREAQASTINLMQCATAWLGDRWCRHV